MFGILVIQLPSNYSGGQLVVYHQSKSMEFGFDVLRGVVASIMQHSMPTVSMKSSQLPVAIGFVLCTT